MGQPDLSSTPRDPDDSAVSAFLKDEGTLDTSHNVTFTALEQSQELFSQEETTGYVSCIET